MKVKKLREKVTAKAEVTYVKKSDLYAWVCAGCNKSFRPADSLKGKNVGIVRGIFQASVGTSGNMFDAAACSYECAGRIVAGKWKELEEYREYKDEDVELGWTEYVHDKMLTARELTAAWEAQAETAPPAQIDQTPIRVVSHDHNHLG